MFQMPGLEENHVRPDQVNKKDMDITDTNEKRDTDIVTGKGIKMF